MTFDLCRWHNFVILCTYARYGSGANNYDNEIQRQLYPWLHIVFIYWIIIDQDFEIIRIGHNLRIHPVTGVDGD